MSHDDPRGELDTVPADPAPVEPHSDTKLDDTRTPPPAEQGAGSVGGQAGRQLGAQFGAQFAGLGAQPQGFVTRQRIANVADQLFGEVASAGPVKIGRFTVVRELGAGGMGVVYVAYDEQLDRRVAVKLLRGAAPSFEARARFEREARAMARLSHANVITVHEVGTFEGQLFVAMEFVDGADLRGWLNAATREWRAVLDLFLRAGEGLAAAHDAGIVHRDFKPDNVLVGADGRVRVADFGLAHALDVAPAGEGQGSAEVPESDTDSWASNPLSDSLTRTGAVMGTPAYMAPEQYRGLATDARTDQFSYCVALWEALYGSRPFSGTNLLALSAAVASGELDAPARGREVPPWIRAILTRGLLPKPEQRWPTMRALLDALANDPQARRRRALIRGGLGALAVAVVGISVWLSATQLRHIARQRYWNVVTEQLLELERKRGLAQATDHATRATDATRMSVMGKYRAQVGADQRQDPTVAAALLAAVEGEARETSAWISAANEVLGGPLSYRVLEGHRDALGPLVFSPDGAWLYSASDDGEVWRWALASGEGARIVAHQQRVNALTMSPDGVWLASGSDDGTTWLWSTETQTGRVLAHHAKGVTRVAIDARGQQLASAAADGSFEVYALGSDLDRSPRLAVTLPATSGSILALDFSPDGQTLVTGSDDAIARVWRVSDGQQLASLAGHDEGIYQVRVLTDGRIVTAADDGAVRLWTADDDEGRWTSVTLSVHSYAITAIDVSANQIVSAGGKGTMRLTSLTPPYDEVELPSHAGAVFSIRAAFEEEAVYSASFDGSARRTWADGRGAPVSFIGHRQAVYSLALGPRGRWLATGSYDSDIRLWDLARPRLSEPLAGHTATVFSIAVDPTGARFVTASHDGSARVWTKDGVLEANLDAGSRVIRAVFSPDGRRVALATTTAVQLWAVDGSERRVLGGHAHSVYGLAFDPSGQRLASAALDETARVWDVDTGAELLVLRGHAGRLVAVAFTPSGEQVMTASYDGSINFWSASDGALLATLRGHQGKITCFAQSRDGQVLATGSDDGTARLWTGRDFQQVTILAGHERPVWSLAFDGGEQRLVTASLEGRARVWSVVDGSLLATFSGHRGEVWDAQFLHDGRVVTAAGDKRVRVWTVNQPTLPIVLAGHDAQVSSLAVLPDGQHLISGAGDGSLRRWRLDSLSDDPDTLLGRIRDATRYCVSVEQRIEELGQDPAAAAAAFADCRSRNH